MPDAFDSLRIGRNAMEPPTDFAERLLGRIRLELGMTTTTTTALRELYYTTVTVDDLPRAQRFFGELFGWQFAESHRELEHAYSHIPSTTVAMGMNDDPETANLWFVADDLEAAVEKVRALGGTAEISDRGDSAVCVDPQGVRFGLGKQTHGPVEPIASIPVGNPGYITVRVPDPVEGRRFYTELLGWQFDGGLANPGFVTVPMGLGEGEPGHDVYFKVDDVDEHATRVRALGGTAGAKQTWPSGEGIPCTDDQGTPFWLYRPAPGY